VSGASLAVGFVNPALLGGLGLLAVPVLIHWLARRRYRRVPWAALHLLRAAEAENRRRLRLEHWLLLLLRCLAVALLVLAVARPYVRPGLTATLLGEPAGTLRLIVLDDSASLQYQADDAPQFAAARDAAARLLAWLADEAPGDAAALYVTSLPDAPLWESATLDTAALGAARDALLDHGPTNLRAAPADVLRHVADRLAARPTPAPAVLYILSDFQHSDWLPPGDGVFAPLFARPEHAPRVVLLSAGEAPRDNVAVTEVRLDDGPVLAGQPTLVHVDVTNHAAQPTAGLTLALEIAGRPLPPVALPPRAAGATYTHTQAVTFDEPGHALLRAALPGDRFVPDDAFARGVHVRAALRVLLVSGRASVDSRREATWLLRHALAPPGPQASGIATAVLTPERLEGADLAAHDAVVLADVDRATPAAAAALRAFVESGGGLVIVLGPQADPATLNATLGAAGADLLPVALRDVVAAATPVSLRRVDDAPRWLPDDGGYVSRVARFWGYVRTTPPALDSGTAVLARFVDEEQTPALLARRIGRGQVVLLTTTADPVWNDWPAAPDGSFVITWLELMRTLARPDDPMAGAITVGDTLTASLALSRHVPTVTFRSPGYPGVPAVRVSALDGATTQPGVADEDVRVAGPRAVELGPHIAELTPRSGPPELRPVGVNLDPRESDLRSATRDELTAALGPLVHEWATLDGAVPRDAAARHELWRSVLLALIAVLLAEQACAWWFGRARSDGSPAAPGLPGGRP
jgi:hypothetical protein